MSFIDLRPYFQARMKTVDSDLREWEDAFSLDNIPSTIIDKSWHIAFDSMTYTGSAHTCHRFNSPITLSVVFKGYRYTNEGVDSALLFADAIVKECTNPVHRLNQARIKNVLPNQISIRELGPTNDNVAVLEIRFDCEVALNTN